MQGTCDQLQIFEYELASGSHCLAQSEYAVSECEEVAEFTEISTRRHGVTEVHGGPVARRPAAGRTNEVNGRNTNASGSSGACVSAVGLVRAARGAAPQAFSRAVSSFF